MSNFAIRVEGLSKQYHIGQRERYRTLRDTLANLFTRPFRRPEAGDHKTTDNMTTDQSPVVSSPVVSGQLSRSPDEFIWALKDVSFDVKHGEVVGIIGRNGAGKSTLLKILSRITEPTEGCVSIHGRVGSLLEVGTGFHQELSGRENIYLNGAILGMKKAEIDRKFDEIVAFAEVEKFIDTPVKHYSTGMHVRLAFAVAAHLEPEILMVDEVLAVGDAGFRKKCLGKMDDVGKEGRTVLFVSHEMNSIRRLCSAGVWLDEGRIREIGDAGDVVRKYEASFLGTGAIRPCRADRTEAPLSPKYFSWASLAGKDGVPTTAFRFGDTVRLTIGMEGRTPHHSHFVEWFINDSSGGNRVAWGATHALREGDIPGDSKEVSFAIGPLPLAEGAYCISLAMGIPAVLNLDFWSDAISFEVAEAGLDDSGYHYTTRYAPTLIPYEMSLPR